MSGLLVKSHAHHARQPRGAERARPVATIPVLLGGAALTRSLRRARPARRLRGPALLRQGRVRGPARDGPARRRASAATSRRRSRLGQRCRRSRAVPARRLAAPSDADGASRSRRARPTSTTDNQIFVPPFTRHAGREGHRHRRHRRRTSTRRRCSATSGATGPRRRRGRRRVQGPHPPDPARGARQGQGRRPAAARRSSTATSRANGDGDDLVIWERRVARPRARAVPFPRQQQGAVPLHRRLLPPDRGDEVDYVAFHIVTMGAGGVRGDGQAVRRRPLPGLPAPARARRRDGRGARRVGTAASARSGASPTRTARRSPACSASSTAAAATRGATRRAPTSRTTPRCSSCSTATASASCAQRGDRLPVPARADHLGDHLPPPQGQVLRRPVARALASRLRRYAAVGDHVRRNLDRLGGRLGKAPPGSGQAIGVASLSIGWPTSMPPRSTEKCGYG